MSREDAVGRMRARAQAATPGPWFREYGDVTTSGDDPRDVEEGYDEPRRLRVVRRAVHLSHADPQGLANAAHIASWHPEVALTVADLVACPCQEHADAVARAYAPPQVSR